MTSDPRLDAAFPTLVERWSTLGWEKDEGIGLLFKEGGYVELLAELRRRAPRTLACVLDVTELGTSPPMLMREVVVALGVSDVKLRRTELDALDVPEPASDLEAAIRDLDPPMSRTFVRRLIEWVDMAAGIEARAAGAMAPEPASPLGKAVVHPKFGRGVIRKIEAGPNAVATIDFETHGEKRLALRFVKIV